MEAVFSPCKTWRYRLDRRYAGDGPVAAIIGVNPSWADQGHDDQTVKVLNGFASRLGWSRIIVGNKFGFVDSDVKHLARASDPVGPANDIYLRQIMQEADIVVGAWGTVRKLPTNLRGRWRTVLGLAERTGKSLQCLEKCGDGHPRHPLGLSYSTALRRWTPPP